ncbi:MAG: GDP-mannose 4,6-dehydratase [Candidatus Woesearchaeota archaeon]
MEGKKILVTGSAGMQGRQIVTDLLEQENVSFVEGVDNFSREYMDDPLEWGNGFDNRFHFQKMAYQDLSSKDLADFDAIVHLAAYISVPESMISDDYQILYRENNAIGTHDLLMKLKNLPEKRWPVFIYASTAETFGDYFELPLKPTHCQTPKSTYAASKLFGESMVNVFAAWFDYPSVAVRSFNTFGPNQNTGFDSSNGSPDAAVVALFIKNAIQGKDLHIHGTGEQTRDFQFVGDAVQAYRMLALSDRKDESGKYYFRGKKYNLGTGIQTDIITLADKIIKISGSTSHKIHTPQRNGEIMALQADWSAIYEDVGYEPKTSLDDGLSITIDWYKKRLTGMLDDGSIGDKLMRT